MPDELHSSTISETIIIILDSNLTIIKIDYDNSKVALNCLDKYSNKNQSFQVFSYSQFMLSA
jgi:hypothetical protein